jgi:hypothetical protein
MIAKETWERRKTCKYNGKRSTSYERRHQEKAFFVVLPWENKERLMAGHDEALPYHSPNLVKVQNLKTYLRPLEWSTSITNHFLFSSPSRDTQLSQRFQPKDGHARRDRRAQRAPADPEPTIACIARTGWRDQRRDERRLLTRGFIPTLHCRLAAESTRRCRCVLMTV